MAELSQLNCCGWKEIYGLEDHGRSPLAHIISSIMDTYDYEDERLVSADEKFRAGAILFTANSRLPNYASRFATMLEEAELGKVIRLPSFVNPNTDNLITTYAWIVNKSRTLAYLKRHKLLATDGETRDKGYY